MEQVVSSSLKSRLLKRWKKWMTPNSTGRDAAFRERTIRGMVPILAFVVIAGGSVMALAGELSILKIIAGMALILVATAVAIVRQKINIAAGLLVLFPLLAAVGSLISSGYWSPAGLIMSYMTVLFGTIVLPRSVRFLLPIGMLVVYGLIAFSVDANGPANPFPEGDTFSNAQGAIMEMTILSSLFFGISSYLLNEFENRRKELARLVESLEDRVAERTRDLNVAADVSRQITTHLDLQELLQTVVERTKVGFNLYHVSIFLYDPETEDLILEAGTSKAGEAMKAESWRFNVLVDKGIVPTAAHQHTAFLVNDTSQETGHSVNLHLPQTRSELALPMIIGDRLVGVLDFQSEVPNRFSVDDVRVMTTLAQQIAIAVQNAHLYAQQVQVAEELRALDNMKSQFLASMSHELRTPLNAILNFTEFVALGMLGPVNEKQVDALNKALDSGKHLLSLINDVLDITKIESGMMKLFVEEDIKIHEELVPIIAAAQVLMKDKPLAFVQDIDDNLPVIAGDRRRIRQIMLNLISNAVKFTEEGSVTLSVKVDDNQILFAVIDTGPGIAAKDQELIFEPFQQSETGIRHASGTGLGLPISKRLAEAHGGRLWVESEVEEGAAFYVTLPVKPTIEITQTEMEKKRV